MIAWEHSGFSIDASVRIALIDRDDGGRDGDHFDRGRPRTGFGDASRPRILGSHSLAAVG